ncbi:MAG: hypothetical protein ACTSX6_04645 [Candidatus Heimdallarchaeaceae archaeon]
MRKNVLRQETKTLNMCPRCKVNRKKRWHSICLKCKWELALEPNMTQKKLNKLMDKYRSETLNASHSTSAKQRETNCS